MVKKTLFSLLAALFAVSFAFAGDGGVQGGASLIGKLEGPEIIRDASAFPSSFNEAPALAEQVKAGTANNSAAISSSARYSCT